MIEKNKQLLTRAEDRISFLYIDKARIEQTEYGVAVVQKDKTIELPITTINCIILGPGSTVTHKALCNIASAGCSICVMGMEMAAFYLYGEPATKKSKNLLLQMKYHEDKNLHLRVIHKMYEIRYPDGHFKSKSVEELRGIEGQRVKDCYQLNADKHHVVWNGREYDKDDFSGQDLPNQYLTGLNHVFYGIITAVVAVLGFSPAIGFIHTGHMQSFIFDLADLYKEKYIIPLAFQLVAEGYYDRQTMLTRLRRVVYEEKLMPKIVNDIFSLFEVIEDDESIEVELRLWGDKNFGISGKNYANEP